MDLSSDHQSTSTSCNLSDIAEENQKLRKENFNLKLKLFIIDENKLKKPRGMEYDDMAKKLDETQKMIDVLNNEIKAKVDLLKEAAMAITRHEQIFKNHAMSTQSEIAEQDEYISLLESKVEEQSEENSKAAANIENMNLLIIKQNDELEAAKSEVNSLSQKLTNSLKSIDICKDEIKGKEREIIELLEMSEKHLAYTSLSNDIIKMQKFELKLCKTKLNNVLKTIEKGIKSQRVPKDS
ncbi:centrosomin-like [Drosophila innubila]|uniref:centrosomin-like n=1 Tax=Drosophila innubila TaxID=198719 RepID=UPI00148D4EE7|nr:centrosomin-like [Drosophila innubila]